MTRLPSFKGYIHDVGGPTGNFRNMSCKKQLKVGTCKDRQCLFPDLCPNLEVDHKEYLDILRTKAVKHFPFWFSHIVQRIRRHMLRCHLQQAANMDEKAMQRALMQYRNPKNYDLVHEALVKAGREDLIGFGENYFQRAIVTLAPTIACHTSHPVSGLQKKFYLSL